MTTRSSNLTMDSACCTCAQLLAQVFPIYDEKSDKPKAHDRRLDCCGRIICGNCIHKNPRFATYCKAPLCLSIDTNIQEETDSLKVPFVKSPQLLLLSPKVSKTPQLTHPLHPPTHIPTPTNSRHTPKPKAAHHPRRPRSQQKTSSISSTTAQTRSPRYPSDTTSRFPFCGARITLPLIIYCWRGGRWLSLASIITGA